MEISTLLRIKKKDVHNSAKTNKLRKTIYQNNMSVLFSFLYTVCLYFFLKVHIGTSFNVILVHLTYTFNKKKITEFYIFKCVCQI